MKYSREILQKRYLGLPKDLKEALFSVETAEKIQKISKKYKLSTRQIPLLAKATGDIILGVELLGDFIKLLSSVLVVNLKIAEKIANDVKNEIFLPIKINLKKSQATPLNKAYTPVRTSTPPVKLPVPAPAPIHTTSQTSNSPKKQAKDSNIYKIRTMKQDIEKAKQSPISSTDKPASQKPATINNVIDLSKK